jgi:8-oxo-dGTP pyrophosphatase MutT (NUDIX family)
MINLFQEVSMKQEKSCGALVFRKNSGETEVLIIRQVQGHWCFPKGHVEKKETEHETALREIKEETGLSVTIIDGFRETLSYSPKAGVWKEVVYFIAGNPKGKVKVQEEELSEIHWVSVGKARSLITYSNDASMFEKALSYLNDHPEALA